jgi:hypothetical protein
LVRIRQEALAPLDGIPQLPRRLTDSAGLGFKILRKPQVHYLSLRLSTSLG